MTAQEIIEKIRSEVERLKPRIRKICGEEVKIPVEKVREKFDTLISFLSDLEKEEKPTNIDFEQELYKHFGQVKDFTLGMQIGKYFYELGRQEKPKKGLHSGSLRKVDNPMKWIEEDAKEPTPAEGLEEEIERMYLKDILTLRTRAQYADLARHFAQWGAEHAREQSKPKVSDGLETEALRSAGVLLSEHFEDEDDDAIRTTALRCWKGGVIHGASWQKEQMMKEAVEGEVVKDISNKLAVTAKINLDGFKFGDKVRVIVCKKED